MKEVIVLGNDHTNSLGIIQCLGKVGYHMIAFMWGNKTGLVQSSRYTKEIYSASSIQGCIDLMIRTFSKSAEKIPIIACCDSAALILEKNSERLRKHFLFEYTTSNYSIKYLLRKENQVRLAEEAGFNVPKSWLMTNFDDIPSNIVYPCLIKPLISCEGAKSDIRICRNLQEIKENLRTLTHTKQILLQQYIERDYEISILGCGKKNGDCVIPCVENKLTLYPKNVGLECLAYMEELKDVQIINSIKSLIKTIGYVGTFSVEMMHCKTDNKFYFTEINLRNDGANSLIFKYGVNLPLHFVNDLLDKPTPVENVFKPGYYIWDMHHFLSLVHRDISMFTWLKEIYQSKGFMLYFNDDKKPFFKQYFNWILSKLRLRKNESY